MFKYKWQITPRVNQQIIEFEAVKLMLHNLPSQPHLEDSLRRHSLLKSAVFSARIEGFTDTFSSPKKESQNLLTAYQYVYSSKSPQKISLRLIRQLHQLTLKSLVVSAGNFRSEPWAIFNQVGVAIYLAPPHLEIPQLMIEYVKFINQLTDHPLIKAAVAQFIFEKIHPFADGNGRVGRLISAFILEKSGLGFRGLFPFEEYLEAHRDEYYLNLEPSINCSGFVEFFITAITSQSQLIIEKLNGNHQEQPEDTLSLRRREILEIIRDHPNCSFDFLSRRFAAINPKTLHYDLSQLLKKSFIRKLGTTNRVVYSLK